MASTKRPNTGEENLTSQEKSIAVRIGEPAPIVADLSLGEPKSKIADLIKIPDYFPIIEDKMKFDFNDITITPNAQTNLRSRYKEVNPFYKNDYGFDVLPLFTAPMDTVVNIKNMHQFESRKINVVLPRTENKSTIYSAFNSYGLNDKPQIHLNDSRIKSKILLDVANGHMSAILTWCAAVKKQYPDSIIMAGNIGNPQTYKIYCDSGLIDYARIGIGNGNGCLTTKQTGVGYPMGSLIRECFEVKQTVKNQVKIVADGGMKDYADIIKALALGADYVMIGSIFSKALESAAPTSWKGLKLNSEIAEKLYKYNFNLKKEYRGMSTKAAQKALGNTVLKTSEGVTRIYNVEYTLSQWVENFESYLRSTMSYCNANTLRNFIGKPNYNLITQNAFNRYNK